jgi:transcriptional regulator of NAD metabolism
MNKPTYLVIDDKTKNILKEYKNFNSAQNYIVKHKLFGEIATIVEIYNYNKKTYIIS